VHVYNVLILASQHLSLTAALCPSSVCLLAHRHVKDADKEIMAAIKAMGRLVDAGEVQGLARDLHSHAHTQHLQAQT
jgi:hypothetical protein